MSLFPALLCAGTGLMFVATSAAFAQPSTPAQPSITTATFADWTQRCVRERDSASSVVCEVMQTLQVEGQAVPVAQIAIARLTPKAPLRLTIVLPVNAAFDKAPLMQIEDQNAQAATLVWRRCANIGCIADVEIKPETLTAWRAATKPGQIQFRNAANQDVTLPFSFRGLSQALDAMPKG